MRPGKIEGTVRNFHPRDGTPLASRRVEGLPLGLGKSLFLWLGLAGNAPQHLNQLISFQPDRPPGRLPPGQLAKAAHVF